MALECISLKLEMLSTHFKNHQKDYAKFATTAAAAGVVYCLWGKYATLCFTATTLITLPSLSKQVQMLTHFDLNTIPQIFTALLIPASYYFVPFLAPNIAPALGYALAVSQINREWTLCSIANATGKEITILRQQNEVLSKLYKDTKNQVELLEQDANTYLRITEQIEQIFGKEEKNSQNLGEVERKSDGQTLNVKNKIQRLEAICESAASQKQLLERVKTANLVESKLPRLTQACSTHLQGIATLTQDITVLKDQLKTTVSNMAAQQEKLRLQLIEEDQWILQLQRR